MVSKDPSVIKIYDYKSQKIVKCKRDMGLIITRVGSTLTAVQLGRWSGVAVRMCSQSGDNNIAPYFFFMVSLVIIVINCKRSAFVINNVIIVTW